MYGCTYPICGHFDESVGGGENYIPLASWRAEAANPSLRGPGVYASGLEYARRHLSPKPTKVELANRMVKHLTRDMLATTLELGERLQEMVIKLKEWNRLDNQPTRNPGE